MVLAQLTNSPAWWQFLSDSKDSFGSVESILKSLAILAGGAWAVWHFFIKRELFPRAILSHKIQFWEHTSSEWLVRVNLQIKNDSTVLMKILNGYTWVQQMKPWPEAEIEAFKEASKYSQKADHETNWPFAGEHDVEKLHNKERELEPGESDEVSMDFFIEKKYKQILIYTYIENSAKPGRNIGWNASTVLDFNEPDKEVTRQGQSIQKARPEKPKKQETA